MTDETQTKSGHVLILDIKGREGKHLTQLLFLNKYRPVWEKNYNYVLFCDVKMCNIENLIVIIFIIHTTGTVVETNQNHVVVIY